MGSIDLGAGTRHESAFLMSKPKTARQMGIMEGIPPSIEKRITLDNWDRPPFNRWAFQHVREILPTTMVSKGNGPAWKLERNEQNFDNLEVFHSRNGLRRSLVEVLEQTYTDGFIVIHGDEIVYEQYFNDMTPATLHLSQSVAKSVTAAVCGILIHQGMIDRDATLSSLIPELKNSGYADACLRQVMDMRSGIRFDEDDYLDPDSDIAIVDCASGWKPKRENSPTCVLDIPVTLAKVREHGDHFEYRSIETDVMAWFMQRATGRRLAELVSELLWQPMGAEFDANYTIDQGGYALADGGFNAALRDYAKVGLLYLRDGCGSDSQVIPEAWVRETFKDGDPDAFIHSSRSKRWPRGAYKNKFWIRDLDQGQIKASGIFGQTIYIDKSNDLVAAALSSWPDPVNEEFELDELDAIDAIARELNS